MLNAYNIDNSFDVQAGCACEKSALNQYVTETLTLVNTALTALGNLNNDVLMKEELTTYLGTLYQCTRERDVTSK